MKTIQFKIPDEYPLNSLETKTLVMNLVDMFTAMKEKDLENFFKYKPFMSELMITMKGWKQQ
jgi:hypothetical protein